MTSPTRTSRAQVPLKRGLSLITAWSSLCLVVACGAPQAPIVQTSPTPSTSMLSPSAASTHSPIMSPTPAAPTITSSLTSSPRPPIVTASPWVTTATPGPRLCSPLEDVTLKELPSIIAGNTFQTPQPGRDDGHPGLDFAFYSFGKHKTMSGLPVKSAMAGKVAAVIPDRKPYGNTVIIEVPLDQVPPQWISSPAWPTPAPTARIDPRLTCPAELNLLQWNTAKRSLYLLYGHLNLLSPLHVGDRVICGQPVGEVGTTGASVNPHLHFETRLGPAGAVISSFGHYDAHTTADERNNYCVWRVSGWFQLIDPLLILSQLP